MFSTQSDNCIPICTYFYIISSFAAEIEEPKTGISGKGLTISLYSILFKPLGVFSYNRCLHRDERNDYCHNKYFQSSEKILAELGIKTATSCSQVRNATDFAMVRGFIGLVKGD